MRSWLHLAAAIAALSVGTYAYRLHVQAPPELWWLGIDKWLVATALMVFALRPGAAPAEAWLRRWVRRAFGVVAVVLLAIAIDQSGRPGHELAAVAATVAALASFILFRWVPFRDEDVVCLDGPRSEAQRGVVLGWALACVAVAFASAAVAINLQNHLAGLVLWLTSLALLPLALRRLDRGEGPQRACNWANDGGPQLSRPLEVMAFVSVLLVGAALRLPLLDRFPAFINSDEARLGRYAEGLWEAGFPNFFDLGWNAFPTLSVLVDFVPIQILGMDIAHLRLASALFGLASLVATYCWARRLWGNVVAVLATLILAVNLQHLTWSRSGLNNIQQIFVGALMLATFARATQTSRLVDWIWFGYAAGLTFHVYHAAKLFPAILFVAALIYAVGVRGFLKRNLTGGLVAFVGFLFVLGPQLMAIYVHWSEFYSNTSNRVDLQLLFDAHAAGNVEAVRNYISSHVFTTLQLFTRDNWPFLDPFTAVPALVGVGWMSWRWRDPRHVVVLLWVGCILVIGGMITAYPPNVPRLIGVLPATCLIPAIVAGRVRGVLHECLPRRADAVVIPIFVAWLSASAYTNWYDVFVELPLQQSADQMTSMCRIIGRTPSPATLYTLGSAGEVEARSAQYDCMMPLDTERQTVSVANNPALIPVVPENNGNAVLFVTRQQAGLVPLIQHYYPMARYDIIENQEGAPQLWAATLTGTDIDRQRGLRVTLRHGSKVRTLPAGLDVVVCSDCEDFPVEMTAEGLVLIPEPGIYSFRSTRGSVEIDGQAMAPGDERDLYAGWHRVVLRGTLGSARDRVTLTWKPPEAQEWSPVPRPMLHTHPERHGLLGRYYEHALLLDSAQPIDEAPDYTRLDAALSFDWNPDHDSAPSASFAGKPSTMEWTGFVDLPEGQTQTLRLDTTATTRVYLDGQPILASPGGFPAISQETTLVGLSGRVPILVRTMRPADDPIYLWWLRLEWRQPGGNWTAFVDYQPPGN